VGRGPDPSSTLIAAARHEFELKLDGTQHSARRKIDESWSARSDDL